VLLAHDTRPSSPMLVDAAAAGVRCMGLHPEFRGQLTTPQLHWMVMRRNQGLPADEPSYYAALAGAFAALTAEMARPGGGGGSVLLHVDCANGVGAAKLAALSPLLAASGLQLQLHNTGGGVLNGGCGSDYVQKDKALPQELEGVGPGSRWVTRGGGALQAHI
jgi:phosphoacetylglucosamine mutase